MKRVIIAISLTLMVGFLSGCQSTAIKPVAGPDSSVAYGNITMPDDKVITRVMLYKVGEVYAPPFKSPPQSHTYTNGNFFFENLTPGKYYLVSFMSGNAVFYFNFQGMSDEEFLNEVAVDIKPGTVNYLGSYRVTGIDENLFKTDTFDIELSNEPNRITILKHLKEVTKGTGWDERFSGAMK